MIYTCQLPAREVKSEHDEIDQPLVVRTSAEGEPAALAYLTADLPDAPMGSPQMDKCPTASTNHIRII